jgi:hypothetical protein
VDEAQQAVATARAFAQAASATRVVLLIDRGEDAPALMVDVDAATAEVTDGDAVTTLVTATVTADPKPMPEVRAIPASAIRIDLLTGELSAPIGAIEHLAQSLRALASTFGGRSVASAEFPTSEPELPITIAAREGEPAILTAADEQYELPI